MQLKTGVLIIIAICAVRAQATTVKVSGHGTAPDGGMPWLEYRLTRLLSAIPNAGVDTLDNVFADGVQSKVAGFFSHLPYEPARYDYDVRVIDVGESTWEARDIPVRRASTSALDSARSLVVSFDRESRIVGVRFELESRDYAAIMLSGDTLQDLTVRQKILSLIENYRTAYDTKNLDFISRILSDDALIIVGREVQPSDMPGDRVAYSSLSPVEVEYLRRDKSEYVSRLSEVFAANESISVGFDSINVTRHAVHPHIYGIALEQNWKSTQYSDHGYLFVLLNFRDEQHPLIHVRSWQKDPFSDGSTIGLGDFDITPEK